MALTDVLLIMPYQGPRAVLGCDETQCHAALLRGSACIYNDVKAGKFDMVDLQLHVTAFLILCFSVTY